MRQLKREVKIGNVTIGGKNPIAVQTMLNVPVEDIEGNVAQAKRCEAAGCQILRVTCPSAADAKCIEAVKNAVNIPIVADIHFDYKAAIACADVGVDKIRINPGNIGDDDRVKAVVDACQQKNIPIRIGVNGGSLEKHILAKYGAPVPEAMVESALYHVHLLEKFDFNNIVISIKNSNVPRMMEAYRQLSAVTDYPLHVGVTEAGTYQMGLLKSGMGIGGMLLEGIEGNVAQAKRCEAAGCQILRVTCPSAADAKCIEAVKNAVNIPIVADIHFDYKAAIACADVGVDKIRINPGNIGDDDRVKAVVDACQQKNIPIRIGVNGGSLEKHILAKYGAPVPEAMVESALYHVHLLEKFDFNNIVISIKNSNVPRMMEAYRQLSAVTDYPLHVGVTEAGTYQMGLLKSGMGIGGMLLEGIGDTIRVSLAADPEKEVEAGYNILRAVGFPVAGPEVITCPTCGRTQYPCTEIANEVERRLQGCKKSIKVAVMGCVVNGPGEAREADIGIAGGKGEAVLFVHGNPVKKLTGDNILDQFMEEIYKL